MFKFLFSVLGAYQYFPRAGAVSPTAKEDLDRNLHARWKGHAGGHPTGRSSLGHSGVPQNESPWAPQSLVGCCPTCLPILIQLTPQCKARGGSCESLVSSQYLLW